MNRGKPSKASMIEAIRRFPGQGILVVGDLMLDKFIWGKVSRISPEAPVPVVDVQSETFVPGGAANVITNLHALGAEVYSCGMVGRDREGKILLDLLKGEGLNGEGIFSLKGKPTTLKTRVIAHSQQVVRVDREHRDGLAPATEKKMLKYVEAQLPKLKAIVVADYAKGLVTNELMQGLMNLAQSGKEGPVPILVDPKTLDFSLYRGVDVIKPNNNEAAQAAHVIIENDEDLQLAAERVLRDVECKAVLITRGEEGMSLFESKKGFTHIPTMARQVYDVTGAGDTVMAVLALCLAVGADLVTAAHISNYAAGVVVGKVGVSTVNEEELRLAVNKGV